jgi:hypothetical protein
MQGPLVAAPYVFTLFDAISFIASLASLVLSILAIWLTLRFKSDADKVNQDTTRLLTEIRSDAKAITEGVMSELRAYGATMRGTFARNVVNDQVSVIQPGILSGLQVSGNREAAPENTSTDSPTDPSAGAPAG